MKPKAKKYPTQAQVAELAGVSTITVSRYYLNNAYMAEKTREKVKRAIEKLGYTPNPLARGLKSSKTHTIGILWSLDKPHRSSDIVRAMAEGTQNAGYSPFIVDCGNCGKHLEKQLDNFAFRRVDGIILQSLGPGLTADIVKKLEFFSSVVVVTRFREDIPFNQICHNRLPAFRQAVDHLVKKGRKNIRFVTPHPANDGKAEAIADQMNKHGLNVSTESIKIGFMGEDPNFEISDPKNYYQALAETYNSSTIDFDALICSIDEGALAAISWLKEKGLRIPEDVAVIGFNNNMGSPYASPPLASIERNDIKLAGEIDRMLLQGLSENDNTPRYKEILASIKGSDIKAAGEIERMLQRLSENDNTPEYKELPMEFIWRQSAG